MGTFVLNYSIFADTVDVDSTDGFRDVKFHDDISKYKGFIIMEKSNDGNTIYYKKLKDSLKIGSSNIKSIFYAFYIGKFYYAIIQTTGFENSRGVLKILQAKYGEGFKDNEYIEHYSWTGEKVIISYDENVITNDATTLFMSREIQSQESKDEEEAAEKAKKEF